MDEGVHFVGSHPIAGSEKRGVAAAVANLYEGAVCVVTPTAKSDLGAVKKVAALWEAVGARVVRITPEIHDGILARTSHLPHLAATMLIELLEDADRDFVGTGFRDTTRIASGDPDIWADVVVTNRDAILKSLADLTRHIDRLKTAIDHRDRAAIREMLREAKTKRDGLFGG
jgi:prephenate dehydrogenase